ncbi:MAG: hypothetical protein CMJ62_15725 [Planctomycetaceae bacterium]|nr:hypothetical protein [Planctomycetaceae bacterium]
MSEHWTMVQRLDQSPFRLQGASSGSIDYIQLTNYIIESLQFLDKTFAHDHVRRSRLDASGH